MLITAWGCGASDAPQLGRVTGRITLDGMPLDGAFVHFQPDSGRPSLCRTAADGGYEPIYIRSTPGVCLGPSRVFISTLTNAEGIDLATGEPAPRSAERVPARYNTESTLRIDVRPGPNRFDFDLTSAP